MNANGVCECGHPVEAHGFVPGFKCSPGVAIEVDGVEYDCMPDVWVCGGGRLVADPGENTSPWEFVCGCVLHSAPCESTEGAA
jgi:hypothetical protein